MCTDLHVQPGAIKRARSSTTTSTTTTSSLPSAVVTPGLPYASVVGGMTSSLLKREPYKPLIDNVSLNDPADPIIIPDDADANNNAVVARPTPKMPHAATGDGAITMTTPPRPKTPSSDVNHSSSTTAAVAPTQQTYRDTPACGLCVPFTLTTQ